MHSINPNWFLEGMLDLEYQQYRLLAYLQKLYQDYLKPVLYPRLAELINTYNDSLNLYQKLLEIDNPDAPSSVIIDILEFANKEMHRAIEDGITIYNIVRDRIHIEPVGILPTNKHSGYVIIHRGTEKLAYTYEYNVELQRIEGDSFYAISMNPEGIYEYELYGLGPYKVKDKVMRKYNYRTSFAFFLADAELCFPLEGTIVPIVKRSIINYTQEK